MTTARKTDGARTGVRGAKITLKEVLRPGKDKGRVYVGTEINFFGSTELRNKKSSFPVMGIGQDARLPEEYWRVGENHYIDSRGQTVPRTKALQLESIFTDAYNDLEWIQWAFS